MSVPLQVVRSTDERMQFVRRSKVVMMTRRGQTLIGEKHQSFPFSSATLFSIRLQHIAHLSRPR